MAYGYTQTWKVVYGLKEINRGVSTGVALIEAENRTSASAAFRQLYAGEFTTIRSIEKLLG